MNPRPRGLAGVAVIIAIATASIVMVRTVAPSVEQTVSGSRYRQWVRVIAPGLTLRRILDPQGPRRIFVLTVDPAQGLTPDVALAQDQLPGLERTSSMAARHGAVVAVNGDFGSGRPTHAFAEDGELMQTSRQVGGALAIGADGSPLGGKPIVTVTALEADTGETWAVNRWNRGPPAIGEIAGFTGAGGSLEMPPPFACSARLLPSSPSRATEVGVVRDYAVEGSDCSAEAMDVGSGVVLSAPPATDEATLLRSLAPGEMVQITWSVGWPRVLDTVGGAPILVSDGQVVLGECTTSFCRRHPRTAVGLTAGGRMLLVVVDGRQEGYSVGMSLATLAQLMVSLGARWAVNLDGGGSSTMVIRGEVVNRPSDPGGERAVSSAVLVLEGADPGEEGVLALRPEVAETGSARNLALQDPASVGGLREALRSGELP